jgi:hypothetical protein
MAVQIFAGMSLTSEPLTENFVYQELEKQCNALTCSGTAGISGTAVFR